MKNQQSVILSSTNQQPDTSMNHCDFTRCR